jgi:hypothetical protein
VNTTTEGLLSELIKAQKKIRAVKPDDDSEKLFVTEEYIHLFKGEDSIGKFYY